MPGHGARRERDFLSTAAEGWPRGLGLSLRSSALPCTPLFSQRAARGAPRAREATGCACQRLAATLVLVPTGRLACFPPREALAGGCAFLGIVSGGEGGYCSSCKCAAR